MVTRRRYTVKERAAVVGLAIAKGQTAAAEESGVPLTTLHQWYHRPEYEGLRTTARGEVAETMWAGVQVGVGEMVKSLQDPRVPLRDKTDATSMLAEKFLLLSGEATTRHESRDITEKLPDHERQALADAIDAWLGETADVDANP